MRQELKKQRQRDSVIRKVILIVILVIAAVYAAGCLFYSSHFYVGGTVFGIGMRNQTVESLKEQIREKIDGYQLTVTTRDGEEEITADQISLDYDDQGEIDALLEEQNAALWFLMFAADVGDYEVDVTMDEGMLGDAVSSLSCMQEENMTDPTDAYLDYEDGVFVIREETCGNRLVYDTVYSVIRDAVYDGLSAISLEDFSCYAEPEITQDEEALVEECEQVNSLLGVEITYDFSDRTMVVDSSVIEGWIVFGEDYTWELDEDAVADYVYEMAYETDTFGLSRTFTTHDGSVITLKGGDYGWCINQSETTEQLIGLVEAGESVTVEPVYRYSGICRDTNDIGDSYVEISISEQTMWVYSDGECVVSTPVVTGNSSRGYDTPSGGVWAVDARITDYTLSGQDYNTQVNYWLPFNGNVGIHDATWRSSFGGDIYKTSGSHGCINTPLDAMKIVYENVQIGYPVVVY
ncbi:MAG: L,D-transpeptidase/peptidoglycan binding protein [Clostridiales bacterium]|nr:L,D-transpeptidase/peptidoglycan binding protein [Clostridiales bacterium]